MAAAVSKNGLKRLLVPLLLALVVYLFWTTIFVWPLRLFVVLLHEVSHGLAAVLTGGRIVSIELSPAEGGLCTTAGGWPFVISSAGYLGSALFGALFLVLGVRGKPRSHRTVTALLGAALLALTLVYVRSAFGFGYGLVAGALLLAVARWLPEGSRRRWFPSPAKSNRSRLPAIRRSRLWPAKSTTWGNASRNVATINSTPRASIWLSGSHWLTTPLGESRSFSRA